MWVTDQSWRLLHCLKSMMLNLGVTCWQRIKKAVGKVVTEISAQRSSKQGGEGGRGGRGNPPSRGAQVGFEQINQSRSREDVLSAPKYSPAVLFRSYPITGRRPSRGTQPCPPSRTSPPPSRWRPSRTA